MSDSYCEKNIDADMCETCPARNREIFNAQLRGSSFRGRLIEDGDEFSVENCVIIIGEVLVANVQIANQDKASAEQDAEVLTSSFEANITTCEKPDPVLTDDDFHLFCAPINRAVDEFIKMNYSA